MLGRGSPLDSNHRTPFSKILNCTTKEHMSCIINDQMKDYVNNGIFLEN